MNAIDAFDVVSLLLGFAIAVVAIASLGPSLRLNGASTLSRVLATVGLGLLLGYASSEVMHALLAMRH